MRPEKGLEEARSSNAGVSLEKESLLKANAHTPNAAGAWHGLKEHLGKVADRAKALAAKFNASELGYYAGLWHDLGKYNPEFQRYLEQCHATAQADNKQKLRGPRHAIHGAILAAEVCPPLSAIIYGHHAGLPNSADFKNEVSPQNPAWRERYQEVLKLARKDLGELNPTVDLRSTLKDVPASKISKELFLRMLFSCLVDADYLDTEQHFEDRQREKIEISVVALWRTFEQKRQQFLLDVGDRTTPVNQVRDQVYQACFKAAEQKPGIFRLSVPTGGGKTLSGLAFALRHTMLNHQFERVIFAVPYTSIIEQTVKVYRDMLGFDAVLEHHSAVKDDWDRDYAHRQKSPLFQSTEQFQADEGAVKKQAQARLATQNWDAPLIVTTTVQLFESLFANRPSRCRKLHNLIGSVIVLDEVQTLPIALLTPIQNVLEELVERYKVSVVYCTATQPPIQGKNPYFDGFKPELVRDIIQPEQAKQHFTTLKRVEYEQPPEAWSWEQLAADVQSNQQALVVLNTRKDALSVLGALGVETTKYLSVSDHESEVQKALVESQILHLSTLLCGAHRGTVLTEVRRRLKAKEPCLLISTQVVEAGVDVDFPVVYRAMGPLDRIVQAAGRCNREGNMQGKGRVVIFEPIDGKTPQGEYGKAVQATRQLLQESELDLHDPGIFEHYFQRLYQIEKRDKHGIQDLRQKGNYPEVAQRFRLINDNTIPVVIRYNADVAVILAEISQRGLWSSDRRKLQPYIVNLPRYEFQKSTTRTELVPDFWIWDGTYDPIRGIPMGHDPNDGLYDPSILTQW